MSIAVGLSVIMLNVVAPNPRYKLIPFVNNLFLLFSTKQTFVE